MAIIILTNHMPHIIFSDHALYPLVLIAMQVVIFDTQGPMVLEFPTAPTLDFSMPLQAFYVLSLTPMPHLPPLSPATTFVSTSRQ
mmetsp:Transcript_41881/g.71649  ORF Transcript_41881/g.71649 Transcript_41881/m.71649 type:complete len:85 (+) Transcript_41881:193-447(+)